MTTPIAAMVIEMIARGVAPEMIALAVSTAEQVSSASTSTRHPPDNATEKRRAWDREYRRNKRISPPESTRIHPTSDDPSLSKNILEEEKREREGAVCRCPPDWSPTSEDANAATSALGRDRTAAELLKFRDHYRQAPGDKGLSADWNATWRKWVSRAEDHAAKTKPPQTQAPTAAAQINWDSIVRTYTKTGHWSPQAGPDPESPACKCPREILEKHSVLAMRAAE